MLTPIQQDRITDVVYTTLRSNILQRHFTAGERLHVGELGRQLGVSRTPIREALNLLAAEGLVEIVPRSGTFVASLSVRDIEDVFDLRICLEGLAAEKVAERGLGTREGDRLREILATARQGETDQERAIHHAEANRAFHHRLVELSGNRKLAQIYPQLNAHTMMALVHYASPAWAERWDLEAEEHERVLSAIERGDAGDAREAMERHLRRGKESLVTDMRSMAADRPEARR